ncbi:tyrosine-type recombinase/integrase [Alteromonas abrolhosensis]|uniref:tyrosine-type recombinase/integrase n=1 Tax=Alteromonas abrolhosensis TaxID=1892904 RepID=UPI00096B88CB|nr:tyrosine-type recombinase/integrase [Alteromonas abrolhosensis]
MFQSQQSHKPETLGYIPSVAAGAVRQEIPKTTVADASIRPMGLKEAAQFLLLSEHEVIALANDGLIAHKYSKTLNKYFFNLRGLSSFCESLANFGHLQESKRDYHVPENSPVDCISSADNSSHNKIDDSNKAADLSELTFEQKEESQQPAPQPELEKQFQFIDTNNERALSRLNHLLTRNREELSPLLDEWTLSDKEYCLARSFIEYFKVKVVNVDNKNPLEKRMDVRSANELTNLFRENKFNLRERLNTSDYKEAVKIAAASLKDKLSQIGINFSYLIHFQEQNFDLWNEVYRKAERLVRDKKSSAKQVEQRSRKIAFFNYMFATTDLRNFSQELVEEINDAIVLNGKKDSTRNKYLIELRAIYDELFAKRLINENIKVCSFQSGKRELIELSTKQFTKFRDEYARCATEANLLSFAFYSGARKGNTLNHICTSSMKLSDIEDLTIRNSSFIKIPARHAKGSRLITIHVTKALREVIERQLEYRRKNNITHDNLFALDDTGTTIEFDMTKWVEALEKAGIDTTFRFHHFRHNRAYQILLEGGTFEDIQQLFGLASNKMVATVYGHLDITQGALNVNEKAAAN